MTRILLYCGLGAMTTTVLEPVALGTVEAFCHLYPNNGNALRSRCGIPRSEQQAHSVRGSQAAAVCAACGLRRCPTCLRERSHVRG